MAPERSRCILFVFYLLITSALGGIHEKRLLAHLFNTSRWDAHNPMERPVAHDGKPLQVFLKCFLNQIMDVDEKNQVLSTIIWLDMKWSDYHFKWNVQEYGNIQQVNLPPSRVWKPDLILYNSASEKFDQVYPTNIIVKSTGEINWIPPGLFHSICSVKVQWFPFDSQNCTLKLGTWTYQGNTVDLKLQCDNETGFDQECHHFNVVDLSTYLAHSEWAMESAVIKRNVDSYGTANQRYIDVTIYIHMQRQALYYLFNIIIPCMIMSVMALLVFTLPPEANEKIVLGVTTLLSLTMLLQLVGDKLPQTSAGSPVLVLYFTCTIVLCSSSLLFAVILLNCHHHTGGIRHVPWLIGTFVNVWLASMLRIERTTEGDDAPWDQKYPDSDIPTSVHKKSAYPDNQDPGPGKQNNAKFIKRFKEYNSLWKTTDKLDDLDDEFRPTFNQFRSLPVPGPVKPNHLEMQAVVKPNQHLDQSPRPRVSAAGMGLSPKRFECACATETDHSQDDPIVSDTARQLSWSSVESNSTPCDSINYNNPHLLNRAGHPKLDPLHPDKQLEEKIRIVRRLRELTREVRYVTRRMHRKDQEVCTSKEWKMACRVLDRLCLLIFAALNLFTTLGILTSAPTIIKAFNFTRTSK